MKIAWLDTLRMRMTLGVACGALAAGHTCASVAPPVPSVEGFSALLSEVSGAVVEPSSLAWEPSAGVLSDLLYGRHVLFLAAPKTSPEAARSPRDVLRARCTVGAEGKPLAIRDWVNLTSTELTDEVGLRIQGRYASYSSVSAERVSSVTGLDTSGPAAPGSALQRLMNALRVYQTQGSWAPLVRTEIGLPPTARDVLVTARDSELSIELGRGRVVSYDLAAQRWSQEPSPAVGGLDVVVSPPVTRSPPALTTLRQLAHEALGAERFDSALALFTRRRKSDALLQQAAASVPRQAPIATWPPEPLAGVDGAGSPAAWRPLEAGPARAPGEPAHLFHTQIELASDARVVVELVAFDLRRLRLAWSAGQELPQIHSGFRGPGSVPVAERSRLVAVFNGGPTPGAAGHAPVSALGLAAQGQLLVPPVPGAHGVVTTTAGALGLGPWPEQTQLPMEVNTVRQTGAALLEGGKLGAVTLEASERVVARSALCRRDDGVVLYAWTEASTSAELARALQGARCQDAVELDSTPGATGFLPVRVDGVHAPLDAAMGFDARAPFEGSVRDFFYLLRDTGDETSTSHTWQLSPGAQPEPSYVPGLFASHVAIGGLNVELFRVDADRVQWRVLAGNGEPLLLGSDAPTRQLVADEADRVLFAFDLGHTTRATRYGLTFDTRETLPLRRVYSTLQLGEGGGFEVVAAGQRLSPQPGATQVQLPLLVSEGELTSRAQERGARRQRGALCINTEGKLVAAFVEHDSSSVLGLVLRDVGCSVVLDLDRGSQHAATFYRAGTQSAFPTGNVGSLLVGLSRPMAQRSFRFGSQN